LNYSASKTSNLNNGDTITLSIDTSDVDQKALDNNYVLMFKEKNYTVENLPYYASSLSDISYDTIEKMKKQAEDVIISKSALWSKRVKLIDKKFIGCYFLKPKSINYFDYNYLYCVYKINILVDDNSFSYYYYVGYKDVLILEDGTCSVDLSNYNCSINTFTYETLWFYGFKDLDSLFNHCVAKYVSDYTYETTVNDD
jgi:hypothetical protein